MADAARLVVQDVTVGYSRQPVLQGVSMTAHQGGVTAIFGPNGSGKSTLIKTVAGLLFPWSGSVQVDDTSIGGVPAHILARRGICLIPQGRATFPQLTIGEHLKLFASLLVPKEEQADRIAEAERFFPALAEFRDTAANRLSGGQQAMLVLSKALIARPRLLLLDEPSIGLSPKLAAELYDQIARLRETGATIVVVEQNVRIAMPLADHVLLLAQGRREFEGSVQEMEDQGEMHRVFFGRGVDK